MKKFSIVIPTYNHCDDFLKPCVESVLKYSDISEIEIIIVANGCVDNTKEFLAELTSRFEYMGLSDHLKTVWSDKALGYSGANNAGIKEATTDYIILLNNDTVLMPQNKHDWLKLLYTPFWKEPTCGVTCVVKSRSDPANCDFAIFFCVMIHRKVFEKIGLLNEEYGPGGGEDTEFCVEAERAGYKVLECMDKKWSNEAGMFVGSFPIYHKGEGTVHDNKLVPNWDDVFTKNSVRLAKKYNPDWLVENGYLEYLQQKEVTATEIIDVNKKGKDPSIDLAWLDEINHEIFKEVILDNCYHVDHELIKDKNVIDVGANVGMFSLLASYYDAKKVVAIEPIQKTMDSLVKNILRLGSKNVITMKRVVGAKTGDLVNISLKDNDGHNSAYNVSDQFETVESISLTDVLSYVEGDDIFLKLDCEGSEYDILLNATPQDMARISCVAMEVHSDMHPVYKGSKILENRLEKFGFTKTKDLPLFSWQLDSNGNPFNYRRIPFGIQIWRK